MGEGKLDEANKILGNCTLLLMILGLAATVVFQLCKEPMLYLFGATENTIGYSMDYLNIYLYGSIFVELALGLNFFITSQGFSTVGMASVIIGAVVNIVLDPILIFGLNMGVKGAALATITAQAVSAVWVVRFLCGRRTKLRIQRRLLRLDAKVLAPVLALGLSPFIMQSTESLVNIAFNSSLKTYGGDPAVGAMTICSSIMQVFSLLFQGLSQGAQPIVGYNYGAGQLDRVKRTFRLLFSPPCALAAPPARRWSSFRACLSRCLTTSRSWWRSPSGRCTSMPPVCSCWGCSSPASRPSWRWARPASPSFWPCCVR